MSGITSTLAFQIFDREAAVTLVITLLNWVTEHDSHLLFNSPTMKRKRSFSDQSTEFKSNSLKEFGMREKGWSQAKLTAVLLLVSILLMSNNSNISGLCVCVCVF